MTINPASFTDASQLPPITARLPSSGRDEASDAGTRLLPRVPTSAAAYRIGDAVGVPGHGELVYRGRQADGRHGLQSRTTIYLAPAELQTRDEVRAWAIRQVGAGAITSPLYGGGSAGLLGSSPGGSEVDRALAGIVRMFDNGVVTNSELKGAAATVERLAPTERRALVDLLARQTGSRGQAWLERWLGEVTSPGLGALSATERKRLFGQLIDGQSAINLVRIHDALDASRPVGRTVQPSQDEFAQAIARQGSADQKLEVLQSLATKVRAGNAVAARAMSTILGSIGDASVMNQALRQIDRLTMDAIVAASIDHRSAITVNQFGGNTVRVTVDASRYGKLADAISRTDNVVEKGGFVASSGQILGWLSQADIGGEARRKAQAQVSAAMSKVIGSDVNGVIENTMLQTDYAGATSGRKALKQYARALIDTGQAAHLGAITLSLQRGNDLAQDPMQWLAAREVRGGEGPAFVRARVMGDWLGILGSAINSRIGERDMAAAAGAMLFSASADTLKEVAGVAFPKFKLAISIGTAVLKQAVNGSIMAYRTNLAREDKDLARGLYEGALPRHPSGVEATGEWVTTMNAQFAASLLRQ